MRGESQATSVRSLPVTSRRTWSSWITEAKRRRRSTKQEHLEVIERLAREHRQSHRAGEYIPTIGPGRRWS